MRMAEARLVSPLPEQDDFLIERWQWLQAMAQKLEGGKFEGPPEVDETTKERLREIGITLWRSPRHAQTVMAHAYAALFSVPEFVAEAHRRQPGRFSSPILQQAIQNTASNLWQAFWLDFDESGKPVPRNFVPLTGVLHVLHGERPIPTAPPKPRISDLAMAFFAFHIIRAAEFGAQKRGVDDARLFDEHFRYLANLIRRSGYRFSDDRSRMETLCQQVDALLVREHPEGHACWRNLLTVSAQMGLTVSPESISNFLQGSLPHAATLFARFAQKVR